MKYAAILWVIRSASYFFWHWIPQLNTDNSSCVKLMRSITWSPPSVPEDRDGLRCWGASAGGALSSKRIEDQSTLVWPGSNPFNWYMCVSQWQTTGTWKNEWLKIGSHIFNLFPWGMTIFNNKKVRGTNVKYFYTFIFHFQYFYVYPKMLFLPIK